MEILTRVFEIEPGKVDRRSQMRVANILTNLSWKKAGQKQHLSKRQVVWRNAKPPLDEKGITEVLRPKSQIGQRLSIPTILSVPNDKTTNKQNKKRENNSTNNSSGESTEGIAGAVKLDKTKDTQNYTFCKKGAIPQKREVNWKTYPYNSSDRHTLKNRANKVKERVLGCTTLHELNELLFSRGANEIELNWLVENYFTTTEIKQLKQIQNSTQTNLFSEPHESVKIEKQLIVEESIETIELELEEIIEAINREMNRIGWSIEDGRQYLSGRYNRESRRLIA